MLPLRFGFFKRPQGHGYAVVRVARPNPFYATGQTLKGHEFHYSKLLENNHLSQDTAFDMERGTGLTEGRDGLCYKNVLATYLHIHASGTPQWAPALVALARKVKQDGSGVSMIEE